MDVGVGSEEYKSRTASWLRAPGGLAKGAARSGFRVASSRPTISTPVGPVKNSRGADFTRSETLIVVEGIKDCVVAPVKKEDRARSTPTGISIHHQVASSPTTAGSQVTASMGIQAPLGKISVNQLRSVSGNASLKPARPYIPPRPTAGGVNAPDHDENMPIDAALSRKAAVSPVSRIPKSMTINSLHGAKTGMHHAEYTRRREYSPPSSSDVVNTPTSREIGRPGDRPLDKNRISYIAEQDPSLVTDAQPSAYWSGRFVSLYDKFATREMSPVPPGSGVPVHNETLHGNKRRHEMPSSGISEEDDRTRRVFRHLELSCITDQARSSLHNWQRAYAKRHSSPHLLPETGPSREGHGIVSKWLGSVQKTGRKSLTVLRGSSAVHTTRRVATDSQVVAGRGEGDKDGM